MIEIHHSRDEPLVTIHASGTLTSADYDRAIPELEAAIERTDEALNAIIDVYRLEGMEMAALWKDLKFDVDHFRDFRRIAVVGRSKLVEWGTKASQLLTSAEIEFFDDGESDAARDWVLGHQTHSAASG
ncbi:STAS/SEC14 domain-containing protein [Rhodobacterales bacterium HKCCE3408]|nr:STAS/SEC14 domain-containing protein [Rhodobacterales bacterium HKCCE3408]